MDLLSEKFHDFLSRLENKNIAVAVSGGPDSMALAYCLTHYTDLKVHILHVDHALRSHEEAEYEAQMVDQVAQNWGACFAPLKWEHEGITKRVQEQARQERYRLMAEYCRSADINHLCLAHHRDDQAETFLFRLAKGSGLDGLCAMRPFYAYDDDLVLVRPFLDVAKQELVALCEDKQIPFVTDTSNCNSSYARVRIRKSREILEEEGLSAKRLALTSKRLLRAREALDEMAITLFQNAAIEIKSNRIEFNYGVFKSAPDEIALRCMIKAIEMLRSGQEYAPRFERIEALFEDMCSLEAFRKRTLGGLIFERDDTDMKVILRLEA